jgi:hypothetical protein
MSTPAFDASESLPLYTIDLSLPPRERYVQVAKDFREQLHQLTALFAEIVGLTGAPIGPVRLLARLLLRRVYSEEETEELKGIGKAIDMELYLIVAFNTLLDSFMGCTSGGVKTRDGKNTKMLHFRTLDWDMNLLRNVMVRLDFVEKPKGEVIARTVTYVGFVGVLTGVRYVFINSTYVRGTDSKQEETKRFAEFPSVP